jgi:hypothetical protein
MPRFRYRVWQFWQTLWARLTPVEISEVEKALSPSLFSLFLNMPLDEQAHALRVFQATKKSGITSPSLLSAALLHDVGKDRVPLLPWQRAMVVIGKALHPSKITEWGQGEPAGWRKPFVVAAHHPEWGAQMAAQAGADELTVRLIREHHTATPDGFSSGEAVLLALLQQADDQN